MFKDTRAFSGSGIFHGGDPLIAWFKDPAGNFLSVIEEPQDIL